MNNERNNLIVKAKNFALKCLNDNLEGSNKEDYYLLLISKFLLLKESIIKKISANKIYFNYLKHKRYLKIIMYISYYLLSIGVKVDEMDVIIEPSKYNNKELRVALSIFHKLRDSLSHGKYRMDFTNNKIIIDNDISNIHCSIPIEIFEFFTFITNNPKDEYDEKDLERFREENNLLREKHNINNMKYNKYFNDYNNVYNNLSDLNQKNINTKDDFINNIKDKYNNDDLYNQISNKEKELNSLLYILYNSKEINKKDKELIINYLIKLGLINKKNKLEVNTNTKKDSNYLKKLMDVIKQISKILGLKSNTNNAIKIASVYNYMSLFFSINDYDFLKDDIKDRLCYLRISKLNPTFVKKNENDSNFSIDNNSQYANIVLKIERRTLEFIKYINHEIETKKEIYEKNPLQNYRNILVNALDKYQSDVMNLFSSKNSYVLTAIRNSVEHGNINEYEDKIILTNKTNQIDFNSTNFICEASCNDFYEIISNLDDGEDNLFNFNDMLVELKFILTKDTYDKLKVVLDKIKNIHHTALRNVLKNIENKNLN